MNKRNLLLLSLLFMAMSGAAIRAQDRGSGSEWRRYKVNDEEFSVTLPTMPAMATTKGVRKSDGKPRLEKRLRTAYDSVYFAVESFENPNPKQSLEQFIAEQGLPGESDSDPPNKRPLTLDGFDGIQYTSGNKTSSLIVQNFATEKHVYRFIVSGAGILRPEVKQFFSSIKLGKKPEGIEVFDGPRIPIEAPDTGETVYKGKDVDVKARLLKFPQPRYTADARKNEISGVVVLKAVFAKNGQVQNIRVVSGLPYGLTEQAIIAARQIKFTPAMKDGNPVSMWMQLEYNFNL
jgi:TonB family protein